MQIPHAASSYDLRNHEGALAEFLEIRERYGPICTVSAELTDGAPVCVVSDPAALDQILRANHKNYVRGAGFDSLKLLLGNGLITSDHDDWRRQRQQVRGGFSREAIERYSVHIAAELRRSEADWAAASKSGSVIDLVEWTSRFALRSVLTTVFGEDADAMGAEHLFGVLADDHKRDLGFAIRLRSLSGVVRDLAEARAGRPVRRPDLLSCLLDGASVAEARSSRLLDEVLTLLVAGHETTASSLAWAWSLLASNEDFEHALTSDLEKRFEHAMPEGWSDPAVPRLDQLIRG